MEREPYSCVKENRTVESSSRQGMSLYCADQRAPQPKRQHVDWLEVKKKNKVTASPQILSDLKVWNVYALASHILRR